MKKEVCKICKSEPKIDLIISGSISPYIIECPKKCQKRIVNLTYDDAVSNWNKKQLKEQSDEKH